jgi:hypothetical protein
LERVSQDDAFIFRFNGGLVFFDGAFFLSGFFRRTPFDGAFFKLAFFDGNLFAGVSLENVSVGGASLETVFVTVRLAFATNASAFANRSFS